MCLLLLLSCYLFKLSFQASQTHRMHAVINLEEDHFCFFVFVLMHRQRLDCAGLTIRIFGLDGRVRLQRLRLSLVIDGLHPEHVLVAFLKTFDRTLGHVRFGSWDRNPTSGSLVHLLDDVTGDRFSAVVFWSFPGQFAAGLGDVIYFERTLISKNVKINYWEWERKQKLK